MAPALSIERGQNEQSLREALITVETMAGAGAGITAPDDSFTADLRC
jgi:hypothetical protein